MTSQENSAQNLMYLSMNIRGGKDRQRNGLRLLRLSISHLLRSEKEKIHLLIMKVILV